ncbi:hypothetical protein AOLI_G00079310 [Acnodon oligacanthus]
MLGLSRDWWSNSVLQYCLPEGRRPKTLWSRVNRVRACAVGERPAQGWALLAAKLKFSGRDKEAEFPPVEELPTPRSPEESNGERKRASRRLLEKGWAPSDEAASSCYRAGGLSGSFAERQRGSADEPGRRRRAER